MKLLIIEDSEPLRKTLVKGFCELGFFPEHAANDLKGLDLALNSDFDAIILDISQPSPHGIATLKHLRDARINSSVLILVNKNQYDDRILGLNLGAADYLCKPFSFEELHGRVLTLIRRSRQINLNAIEIGDVVIDTQLKQIRVHNHEVVFTPLEYSIIEQLAINLDRVLSTEQLLSHLYGSRKSNNKNTIEAHISSARKKLKGAGADNFIKTKRSFGYLIRKPSVKTIESIDA
ncbi:MAG: two-component system response regulator [SAR86 cluster bacterium]|uniref:Two-component system response regulator n=1 Tax=SAR86 cluster bacterium TaxID=2030880 RepID=A0A2A4MPX2_9GAMM|nr:MAG: two-component system response regulator [SAR86 cluster bacterium]